MGSTGEDVEAQLRRLLGLSGYEARVYLALLRLGSARPVEAAEEAGVPPQRVYDVLRNLEKRGLIVSVSGTYKPIDPHKALRVYSKRVLLEAHRVSQHIEKLAKKLGELARAAESEYVVLVKGVEASIAAAMEAVESCSEKPFFIAHKAVEKLEELWPLLKQLLKALKVGALVIVPPNANIDEKFVREAEAYGVSILHSNAAIMDLMAACDTVIIGLPSREEDVVAVVVKSRPFARALIERLRSVLGSVERKNCS